MYVQTLEELCSRHAIASPLYQLFTAVSPEGVDTQLYLFKVTLLGQTLTPPKLCASIEEARQVAAEFALQQLQQLLVSSGALEPSPGTSPVPPALLSCLMHFCH